MAKFHTPTQHPNGNYRVYLGGRRFWLGKDVVIATKLTRALELSWDQNKKWSPEEIKKCFQFCGLNAPAETFAHTNPTAAQAPEQTAPAPTRTAAFKPFANGGISLHKALDLYLAEQKRRYESGEIKKNTYRSNEDDFKSIKRLVPDQPLHQITAPELKAIGGIIKARPKCARKDEPISIPIVWRWLMDLGMAFSWFSHPTSRIEWKPPYFQWRENFTLSSDDAARIVRNKPTEKDKDHGKIKPTFTIDHLKLLYKKALPTQRLYLLCGVLLGWTQTEIAHLKREQISIDSNGEMFVTKDREKTGVPQTWWICPELQALITEHVERAKPNADNLAFTTINGLCLLHGKTDNVRLHWERLLYGLNKHEEQVPDYPFSRLRKFAGQAAQDVSGDLSIAQMLLAHRGSTVAQKHYVGTSVNIGIGTNPVNRLHDVMRQIHKALKPMFDAGVPKNKRKPPVPRVFNPETLAPGAIRQPTKEHWKTLRVQELGKAKSRKGEKNKTKAA